QGGALGAGETTGGDGIGDVTVLGGVDDDGHGRVVLRGGADHGRAADVDLLDAGVEVGAGGDGRGERVQVHHDQLERLDAEVVELREVVVLAGVGEDPGVDARVQR